MTFAFHFAAFLSAFLLFSVQPLMAKALLPALGGSAVVWGTCMVSFQGLLFLGYLGSHHALSRWPLGPYLVVHVLVLGLAAVLTPVFGVIHPLPPGPPWWTAFVATLSHVGLPFFLLSFSTPLLQRWWSDWARSGGHVRTEPYRLFSISNAGSLAALLAYPCLIEPRWSLSDQSLAWRMGLFVMAGLLGWMALRSLFQGRSASKGRSASSVVAVRTRPFTRKARVFALSASGCALLLAVTNAVTFDLSSAPLLWVGPLALYLLSFVVVFKRRPWLVPESVKRGTCWWLGLGLVLYAMGRFQLGFSTTATTLCQWAVVAFGCWRVHGRLAELKPEDDRALTGYYVAMSAGGVVGSMLVSWVIPTVFATFVEYPLALAAVVVATRGDGAEGGATRPWREGLAAILITAALLLAAAALSGRGGVPVIGFAVVAGLTLLLALARKRASWLAGVALAMGAVVTPMKDRLWGNSQSRHYRNHYGIYEVAEKQGRRYLTHGTTNHGIQNLASMVREVPLSYYHREGPAGALLGSLDETPHRIGMMGLGAGALAAYTRPGDVLEVFELDPLNIQLAEEWFTYLKDRERAGVDIRVLQGDGRRALAGVEGVYDILILDAFSSGSIPIHLLTREAVASYLNSVKEDGVILLHISNRALRLRPMIASVGRALGAEVVFKDSLESLQDPDLKSSDWALLSPSDGRVKELAETLGWESWEELGGTETLPTPWTDEKNALLAVWRW